MCAVGWMLTTSVHGDKIVSTACISLSFPSAFHSITFLLVSFSSKSLEYIMWRHSLLLDSHSQLSETKSLAVHATTARKAWLYHASAMVWKWRSPLGLCVESVVSSWQHYLAGAVNCRRWGLDEEVSHLGGVILAGFCPRPFLSSHCFLSALTWTATSSTCFMLLQPWCFAYGSLDKGAKSYKLKSVKPRAKINLLSQFYIYFGDRYTKLIQALRQFL